MTDRDEQIKEIVNLAIDGIDALVKFWDNENEAREDFEAVKETLKPILALLQDPWIPVSERLPELKERQSLQQSLSDDVLVTDGYSVGIAFLDINNKFYSSSGNDNDEVESMGKFTHWQPIVLPKEPCKICGGSGKVLTAAPNLQRIPCPDCKGPKGE